MSSNLVKIVAIFLIAMGIFSVFYSQKTDEFYQQQEDDLSIHINERGEISINQKPYQKLDKESLQNEFNKAQKAKILYLGIVNQGYKEANATADVVIELAKSKNLTIQDVIIDQKSIKSSQ